MDKEIKNGKQELSELELDSVVGGIVTYNWDANTQTGTVSSDQVAGTLHYDASTALDVHKFVRRDAIDYSDEAALNYLKSQNWAHE